ARVSGENLVCMMNGTDVADLTCVIRHGAGKCGALRSVVTGGTIVLDQCVGKRNSAGIVQTFVARENLRQQPKTGHKRSGDREPILQTAKRVRFREVVALNFMT